MGRWMAPFAAVLINRSDVNPIGLDMVPPTAVIPAMQEIDVTLIAEKHMSCQYMVRVRADDDRLLHESATPTCSCRRPCSTSPTSLPRHLRRTWTRSHLDDRASALLLALTTAAAAMTVAAPAARAQVTSEPSAGRSSRPGQVRARPLHRGRDRRVVLFGPAGGGKVSPGLRDRRARRLRHLPLLRGAGARLGSTHQSRSGDKPHGRPAAADSTRRPSRGS